MLNSAEHEISTKMLKNNDFLASELSDVVFIMLINVKMPTIVGILTFMSRINLCSVELSMKKVLLPRGLAFSSFHWILVSTHTTGCIFTENLGLFPRYFLFPPMH